MIKVLATTTFLFFVLSGIMGKLYVDSQKDLSSLESLKNSLLVDLEECSKSKEKVVESAKQDDHHTRHLQESLINAEKEKEALQLKRAGTIFDMENIQIVAALQGQIDGEQRLRLVALLALNNDIAEAAEKSAAAVMALNAPALANLGVIIKTGDTIETVIGKLINAQAKTALLDLGITNIPKAKNPFEAWDDIFKNIIFNLDTIANKIKNMPTVTSNTSTTTTTYQTLANSEYR